VSDRLAPRAIVFDLDGTLIDSRRDIAAATLHALASHGFPALEPELIYGFVGDGARALLARAAAIAPTDPRLAALLSSFLAYYAEHPLDHTSFCPGAEAALSELSFLPLAICTNKPRLTTLRVLEGLGIGARFAVVLAGDDLPKSKPDPLPIRHIAERLELKPGALVVVGDGAQDVLAGRAAGARTVGVEGGIQPLSRLTAANPDVLISSLSELPNVVRGLLGER
jgi:phosphoglycolate phosphatase